MARDWGDPGDLPLREWQEARLLAEAEVRFWVQERIAWRAHLEAQQER